MLESLIQNPEQITFPILFVGLLVYVMKTNDDREKQYRDTIDRLTNSLYKMQEMEEKVDDLHERFVTAPLNKEG